MKENKRHSIGLLLDRDVERQERLGMIALAQYGAGKVVVASDDAIFIDMFMNEGDNRKLGRISSNGSKNDRDRHDPWKSSSQ